jgi:hypothetical protein
MNPRPGLGTALGNVYRWLPMFGSSRPEEASIIQEYESGIFCYIWLQCLRRMLHQLSLSRFLASCTYEKEKRKH